MKSKVFVLEVIEVSALHRMAIVRDNRGTVVDLSSSNEGFDFINRLDLDSSTPLAVVPSVSASPSPSNGLPGNVD